MSMNNSERIMGRRDFLKTAAGLAAGVAAFGVGGLNWGSKPGIIEPAYGADPGTYDRCRVVVFGADALSYDNAVQLRNMGAPALNALNEPFYVSCGGLSSTQPGWAEVWSGLPSAFNQVYENRVFGRIPGGKHIFAKLIKNFHDGQGKDIYGIWVTGKGRNIKAKGAHAPHWSVYRLYCDGEYSGSYHGHGECETCNDEKENAEVFEKAGLALEEAVKHDNFLAFIHFRDPDHTGHGVTRGALPIPFGKTDHDVYMESAMEVDNYIFDLMDILPADTSILYCSDHGFDFVSRGDLRNGHRSAPDAMGAVNSVPVNTSNIDRMSLGRFVYRSAGGNPGCTPREDGELYEMFGRDLN